LVYDADDDLAFLRVIDCLPLGIGEKTVETLALSARQEGTGLFRALAVNQARKFAAQPVLPRIAELQPQVGQLSVSAMLDELLEISGYRRRLEERDEGERLLNLTAFAEFVKKWEAEEGGQDFFDLLSRTSLESRPVDEEQRKPVYLLTMHNAKGLEFPTVILAGINATYMPFFLHRGKEELAEERRLFYVACTRACDLLVLSTASLRRSPFLAAIPPAILREAFAPEDVLPALLPERRRAEAEVARRFVEHPLFGRGWVLEELPGKKFLIDFADKGKKVIDSTVVTLHFL
jgi:DNA helicase-2/ATP-dependent DNA helicase PcrA